MQISFLNNFFTHHHSKIRLEKIWGLTKNLWIDIIECWINYPTSNYPQQIRAIALFNQNNPDRGSGRVSKLNKCSDPNLSQPPATQLNCDFSSMPDSAFRKTNSTYTSCYIAIAIKTFNNTLPVRNLSLKAWGLKEKSNKPFWPASVLIDYVFWVKTPWDA